MVIEIEIDEDGLFDIQDKTLILTGFVFDEKKRSVTLAAPGFLPTKEAMDKAEPPVRLFFGKDHKDIAKRRKADEKARKAATMERNNSLARLAKDTKTEKGKESIEKKK